MPLEFATSCYGIPVASSEKSRALLIASCWIINPNTPRLQWHSILPAKWKSVEIASLHPVFSRQFASFLAGRYINSVETILKLSWLPMKERRDRHLLKAAHKVLHHEHWPTNMKLETVNHCADHCALVRQNKLWCIRVLPAIFTPFVEMLFPLSFFAENNNLCSWLYFLLECPFWHRIWGS